MKKERNKFIYFYQLLIKIIMTETYQEPWYRAGKEDNFSVREKIVKGGCRDVYRGVVECRNDPSKDANYC